MKETLRLLLLVTIAFALYRLWVTFTATGESRARKDAEAIARWEALRARGFVRHMLTCDYTRFFVLFYLGSAMANAWRRTGSAIPSVEVATQYGILGVVFAGATSGLQWRDIRRRAEEARRRRSE